MDHWGSFVMQAIPAVGLLLAGSFRRAGWMVCLCGQGFALAFGVSTHQWGFVFGAPVFTCIYLYNWIRWNRTEERDHEGCLSDPDGQGPAGPGGLV